MSKIIEKAFDASKKIIRSIFRGSPSLITSSDLNRQFEAIKYQLDKLDEKTGFLSDIKVSTTLSDGTLGVSYGYSYMVFKGCQFKPAVKTLNINLTRSASTAYLCLVADTKVITYNDDSSHLIAGAKFDDGKTYPAADQLVYYNESLVLTHSLSSIPNLIGVVSVFTLSETGNVIIRNNISGVETSLPLKSGGTISDLNSSAKGAISNGQTYDEAISILDNRFLNIAGGWTKFIGENENYFRIQNGVLTIDLASQELTRVVSRMGGVTVTIGQFPTEIKTKLITYFNSLGLRLKGGHLEDVSSYEFIPFGNFGSFSVYKERTVTSEPSETPPTKQPAIYGTAKVAIILAYYGGEVSNVFLGAYVDHVLEFNESKGAEAFIKGPVSWLRIGGCDVIIPRLIGSIALQGVF